MDPAENNMLKLNREKKIKSQLVSTRQIIQDKFQKVKRDRMLRENELNEQYKPLTQAIDKLNSKAEKPVVNEHSNSSTDELEWDYDNYNAPMDYDSVSDFEEYTRQKNSRWREDDDIDVPKRMRISHPKRSKELSQKIKKRLHLKKMRKQARMFSKKSSTSKSKKKQPLDIDSDDESDTFVHSIDRSKRSRLEKSSINEKANLNRIKNNRKITEMRKVDEIMMGVKNKAIADSIQKRDNIIEISDTDIDSENDEMPKKQKNKKKNSKLATSFDRRHDLFKRIAAQKLPETIVSQQGPVTVVHVTPKENKKKEKTEKRGSGIEVDFIPYNENVAYEFYDDPNELCERLRLLVASRAAGNSNHSQEINSIISELREAGVIY